MRPRFSKIALLGALAASSLGGVGQAPMMPQPVTVGLQQPVQKGQQLPAPVQTVSAQQMIRQISGGFSMISPVKHPIWIGRLRDSGYSNRGVSRRGR